MVEVEELLLGMTLTGAYARTNTLFVEARAAENIICSFFRKRAL
jgi:hypothetical protein